MKFIYVSTNGNDKNDGGEKTPLKTLAAARDLARGIDGEKTVIIEGGRYFFTDTLELDARDSGTHYKAKDGETVYFDGGIILDNSDIKDFRDGIKVIDLEKYGIDLFELGNRGFRRAYVNAPNELFIDGEAKRIARYPKKGIIYYGENDIVDEGSKTFECEFDGRGAVIKINEERFDKWADAKHAYLAGYPQACWADECVKIAKFDREKRTVTTEQPHVFGYKFSHHSGYYIVNLLEELTDPGEYYIDIDEKKLYFIPESPAEIKNALIQLSSLGKVMVAIENADNVSFDGITFENSRNSGVYIEGGDGCKIANCTFRNLGVLAVQIGKGATPLEHNLNNYHCVHSPKAKPFVPVSREMGNWNEYIYEFAAWDNNGGRNHSVEGCRIYGMGAGGILLGGGNRKRLIPAGNRVYNCEMFSNSRLDRTYKGAVTVMGVGNTVSHCKIYDMPASAIYLHGNDHTIEYNEIFDVVTETSDAGAIYMGRDMSEVGNVFRNNYFHDITNRVDTGLGVCALYFDDWDIFNTVYDNFFCRISSGGFGIIHHTCGGLLSFHNNFVIDCMPGINADIKSNSYIMMHKEPLMMTRVHTTDVDDMRGVDITSEVYRKKYPYLYEVYRNDYRPEWMYYNNLYVYKKYDKFVDGANDDFTQVPDFDKVWRDEYDWMRRTDVVMGYKDDLIHPHRVDFKSIGIIKK